MKKLIIAILLNSILLGGFGQVNPSVSEDNSVEIKIGDLESELKKQEAQINSLYHKYSVIIDSLKSKESKIIELQKENSNLESEIQSLVNSVSSNQGNIQSLSTDLDSKIQQTEANADTKIKTLDKNVGNNQLYWIIGSVLTLIIIGVIFWLLAKRISLSRIDVESKLNNTKRSLEEESVRLDGKLVEVLEKQLRLQENQNETTEINTGSKENDHSLAIKVADEIIRMERYISRIDPSTKGIKPLVKGVEKLHDNLKSKGYSIENLLNMEYEERMNIDVITFKDDDELPEGKKVISRIIKPQVNFNGILIQRAQVDVTQN